MKKNRFYRMMIITGLMLVFLLTGCTPDSSFTVGSFENNTKTSTSMKYQRFNGQKTRKITVEKGKKLVVSMDIVTESGSLSMSIKNDKEESFYTGTDMQTSSFQVDLDKAGEYTITLKAKNHKGSYKVSWEEQEQK